MSLVFTLEDIKRIVKAQKKHILRWSIFCSVATLCYFARCPLEYEARATFKQSAQGGDQGLDLKNLLRSFSRPGREETSTTVMLSDVVLEKTIAKLGLQTSFKGSSIFHGISVLDNLLAEIGLPVQAKENVRFSSVSYEGEKPLTLLLKRVSKTEVSLYDKHHHLLTSGLIGQPLVGPTFQLTVETLGDCSEGLLALLPIQTVIPQLRKKIKIKPTREDKNLLLIKCATSDRKQSAEIVNTLMAMYEKYLIDENKLFIGAQIAYLNQRRDELSVKLDHDIQEHAQMLRENIQTQGFLGIKDEIELILHPLQTHKLRLDAVELELDQMEQRIAKVEIDTKQTSNKPQLIERYSKALADQISSATQLLEQVHKKEKITHNHIEELQPAVEEFNLSMDDPTSERLLKIETLAHEFIKHLHEREKTLRDSSHWIQTAQNDLSGISLEAAHRQFSHYSIQFDELQVQLKQLVFMRDHLFDPHFEIGTLLTIVSDAVSQQMVQKSSELEALLHDDIHRSSRDRERLRATLAIHKRFLRSHLDQTLQLGQIRIELIKENLTSLYTAIKTLLLQEQKGLHTKINELKHSMQSLPELWVHENQLKFKSQLTKGMMEGLVAIAESKNLAHHLYQVESKPLDRARIPLSYVKPLLLVKTALTFSISLTILTLLTIIQALLKGFPVSLATLQELGAHTSGSLSLKSPLFFESANDHERNTLRRIASYLIGRQGKGVVALLGEQQTLFFPALTELLKKHHKTSCVIDCSFGKILSTEEAPGLFQVLHKSSTLEIMRSCSSYDFLPVGASSPEGVELLKSNTFARLTLELANRYDFVFLVSRTPIHALESEAILERSTHAVVVAETPLEKIKPYLYSPRQKEKTYATFIQYV